KGRAKPLVERLQESILGRLITLVPDLLCEEGVIDHRFSNSFQLAVLQQPDADSLDIAVWIGLVDVKDAPLVLVHIVLLERSEGIPAQVATLPGVLGDLEQGFAAVLLTQPDDSNPGRRQ